MAFHRTVAIHVKIRPAQDPEPPFDEGFQFRPAAFANLQSAKPLPNRIDLQRQSRSGLPTLSRP